MSDERRRHPKHPRRRLRSGRYGRLYCDILTDDKKNALLEMGAVGYRAFTLWSLGTAHATQHKSDGLIRRASLKTLAGNVSAAEALVAVGLWERDGDDYRYVKWAAGNYLKAEIDAQSLEGAINQCERWMDKGRECSCGHHDADGNAIGDPVGDLVAGLPIGED